MMSPWIRVLAGSSLLSAAFATMSMSAERSPPGDKPDARISVVPEPTESPRYLQDESKVTQGRSRSADTLSAINPKPGSWSCT